ncbi:unnamed protein product [Sphagnum tenellum]
MGGGFLGCQYWRSFRGCQCCQRDLSRLSRRRSSSGHSRRHAGVAEATLACICVPRMWAAGCGRFANVRSGRGECG